MRKLEEVEADFKILDVEEMAKELAESLGLDSQIVLDVLDKETQWMGEHGLMFVENEALEYRDTQSMTYEFHEKFSHPIADEPTVMTLERSTNRAIWTGEELIEHIAASATSKEEFSKAYYAFEAGLQKAFKKSLDDAHFDLTEEKRLAAQVDALGDASYFVHGSAVEQGVILEEVVGIIHQANLSKLFTDEEGNKYAKYREDGKVLKSPDFYSPDELILEYLFQQK